jgi:hypothetical protein
MEILGLLYILVKEFLICQQTIPLSERYKSNMEFVGYFVVGFLAGYGLISLIRDIAGR